MVLKSVASALQYYAPDTDPAEIQAAADCMINSSHGVLTASLGKQTCDTARLLRMLRVSIYALAASILLPIPGGEHRDRNTG
jgi:hypothetical protein